VGLRGPRGRPRSPSVDPSAWLDEPSEARVPWTRGPCLPESRLSGYSRRVFPPETPIGRMGEKALVRYIRSRIPPGRGVSIGIGDDAAAVETGPLTLMTTDSLVEGIHFRREWGRPRSSGCAVRQPPTSMPWAACLDMRRSASARRPKRLRFRRRPLRRPLIARRPDGRGCRGRQPREYERPDPDRHHGPHGHPLLRRGGARSGTSPS
jgi:hypothetical protein